MGLFGPSNDTQAIEWINAKVTDPRHAAEARSNYYASRRNNSSVSQALEFIKRDLRKLGYKL